MEPKKKLTERDAYEISKEAMGYMSDMPNLPADIDSFRRYLASIGLLLNVCPRCGSVGITQIKSGSPQEAKWPDVKWKDIASRFLGQPSKKSRKKILRFKCSACDKEFEVREIG